MTTGGEQMAASALAGAHPLPSTVPIRDVREILRAREPDVTKPALASEPARKLQKGVVAKHERDDRPNARTPDGVAHEHEFLDIEGRRFLEDEMLACLRRCDSLGRMQVVGCCNRYDVDVIGGERIFEPC